MMRLLFVALILLATNAWAVVGVMQSNCVDATTITASFTDGAALIVSSLSGKSNTFGENLSDAEMDYCFNAVTAAGCNVDLPLPVGPSSYVFENLKTGDFVRVRHTGVAATSGRICAGGW